MKNLFQDQHYHEIGIEYILQVRTNESTFFVLIHLLYLEP